MNEQKLKTYLTTTLVLAAISVGVSLLALYRTTPQAKQIGRSAETIPTIAEEGGGNEQPDAVTAQVSLTPEASPVLTESNDLVGVATGTPRQASKTETKTKTTVVGAAEGNIMDIVNRTNVANNNQ